MEVKVDEEIDAIMAQPESSTTEEDDPGALSAETQLGFPVDDIVQHSEMPRRKIKGKKRKGFEGRKKAKIKGPVQASEIIDTMKTLWPTVSIGGKATSRMPVSLGWVVPWMNSIRLRDPRDFVVALHELGHYFDHQMGDWTQTKGLPKGIREELLKLGKELYGSRKPNGGYKREGFAEFFRFLFLESKTLADKAPNLHHWWHAEYLPAHPEEAAKLNELYDLVNARINQTAREDIRAFRKPKRTDYSWQKMLSRLFSRRNRFEKRYIDRNRAILRVMEVAGVDINSLTPSQNPFWLSTAYSQAAGGRALNAATEQTINLDGEKTGQSLEEAFAPVASLGHEAVENWTDYYVARRVLNLHEQGIEPGISVRVAREIVEEHESEMFSNVVDEVTDWSRRQLYLLVEAGVLTEKEYADIIAANPVYVPFFRQQEESNIKKGKGSGRGVYKIKGSTKEIEDPLASLLAQSEKITANALQADVIRALYLLVYEKDGSGKPLHDIEGRGTILQDVEAPKEMINFEAERIREQLVALFGERYEDAEQKNVLERWDERLQVSVPAKDSKISNIFRIVINGKRRFVEIKDENLLEALNLIAKEEWIEFGNIGPILRQVTGLQRLGATGLSPQFNLFSNVARDIATMTMTSQYHTHIPIISAMRGALQVLRGSEQSLRFRALGGALAGQIGQDKVLAKEQAGKVFKPSIKNAGVVAKVKDVVADARTNPLHTIWSGMKTSVNKIRDLLGVMEEAVRLTEFEPACNHGTKEIEAGRWTVKDRQLNAITAAKDSTVDFTRKGTWGARLNEVMLFVNAGIQSIEKVARMIGVAKPMPWQTKKTRLANLRSTLVRGGIGLATVASWAYLSNRGEDWWEELPPEEKWGYLHFNLGENWGILRLPLPFELGFIFGSGPVAAMESMAKGDPEFFWEWFGEALHRSTPIDVGTRGEDIGYVTHDLLANFSVLGPLVDVMANRDWKGDRLVNQFLADRRETQDQYTSQTTEIAKMISKLVPGISPINADHILKQYTGNLFHRLFARWDEGFSEKFQKDFNPMGKALRPLPQMRSRLTADFYDELDRLRAKKGSGTASLEEIGRLSSGDDLRRKLSPIWEERKVADDQEKEDELMKQILDRLRSHEAQDFKSIGESAVLVAGTDPSATNAEKERARKLLSAKEINRYVDLLKRDRKSKGLSATRWRNNKQTPFGHRIKRLKEMLTE